MTLTDLLIAAPLPESTGVLLNAVEVRRRRLYRLLDVHTGLPDESCQPPASNVWSRRARTTKVQTVTNRSANGTAAGFGCRVTAVGAKSFILSYGSGGRERRITIGSFPDWATGAAREKELKRRIDDGEDPMGQRHKKRERVFKLPVT